MYKHEIVQLSEFSYEYSAQVLLKPKSKNLSEPPLNRISIESLKDEVTPFPVKVIGL